MNTFYKSASEAMAVAFEVAQQTGRRVWRHTVENKYGATRWLISFESDADIALQGLTA